MANLKDNGFHVRLDGIKLSEDARNRIQAGIQEVLLRELAGYFPDPENDTSVGNGLIIIPPKYWRGIWFRSLALGEAENLKGYQSGQNSPMEL
jgi:hypothetical protein